jgi:hypothetical protein
MSSLALLTALVLVGRAVRSDGPPPAAGPGQGLEEVAPPVPPLRVGETAPDFTLRDPEGRPVRLNDYRGRMPVVIEFGSLSCPILTGRADSLDALAQDCRGKAEFWFVYGNEEHPGHGDEVHQLRHLPGTPPGPGLRRPVRSSPAVSGHGENRAPDPGR